MVRKKRKGVVKDAVPETAVVDLGSLLPQAPVNADLPWAAAAANASGAACDLKQWYAILCATDKHFDQLKLLQLFRSNCKAVASAKESTESVEQFVSAAWRLFFRLYVADGADSLQKPVGLILNVLAEAAAKTRSVPIVAFEELRSFLDALWSQNAQITDAEDCVRVVDLLLLVVEMPFLARVLAEEPLAASEPRNESYLLRFVSFCAAQLAFLAQPITDYHATSQDISEEQDCDQEQLASTNVILLASERCGHVLKCIILVCTMKEFLYERLEKLSSETQDVTADFSRMLAQIQLLLQTHVVHKDLLTQAGLAYCLLRRLFVHRSLAESASSASMTALMIQVLYPEQSNGATAAASTSLDTNLVKFDDRSRLAICRGMLNSLSDEEIAGPSAAAGSSVLDQLFTTVQVFCHEESLSTRLFAFQVLEAFLRRAVLLLQRQQKDQVVTEASLASNTLVDLTALVLLNWEHPSKKVNQFMPIMFAHVVNYLQLANRFAEWKISIVSKLMELPEHSRAKYGALAILLGEYGANKLLQENPTLLASVLAAVGHRDVSAAAANLFAQILDEIHEQNKKSKEAKLDQLQMRSLWIGDVAQVLVCEDAKLRVRVATYVLPLLLKKDPDSVMPLIESLRAVQNALNSEVCLWAIIEVLKFARKRIAPEKLLGLSTVEIEEGLSHTSAETRRSAFDALCASLKSTTMPSRKELRMIQTFLVVSGKEITPASRTSTIINLKTVFFRVKESLRINSKINEKAKPEIQAQQAEEFALAQSFKKWIEVFVVSAVYPGAIPQRIITGLEIMLLYIQIFGFPTSDDGSMFTTPHTVTSLLNMLISSWDAIRSLSYAILDLYPDSLPGYSSREELLTLLKWSMALCVSPRQRESDAGALFMRLLFKRSKMIQDYAISFDGTSDKAPSLARIPQVEFVLKLADVILARLNDATLDLQKGESPLVHGFLLSLRYILENTEFKEITSKNENAESAKELSEWKLGLGKVFACVQNAMRMSLCVVGDATSGIGDSELSAGFAGVVGEVSAVAKAAPVPLRVDCRGHLILDDAENTDDAGGDSEQRAVVGSWLAARECGAILDTVMRRVALPAAADPAHAYFTAETAQQCGEMILNSLFELKHKGAVAMAYQSFEGICRSFLAHGEKNSVIGNLPSLWADRLLERLEKAEQHFILRRSSGFAFSFVAILRSEPRNTAAVILPKIMTNLMLLAGMDTDDVNANASQSAQQQHSHWRSRVHALNILKLICQDAILADDVATYVSGMLEISVFGFDCSSWAVRNSAMMLFAAATQRAIGDKRIADGASKLKVSSTDVFSRFQDLSGFLFRELEKCTQNMNGTTPPGLFPILMFLSRLKPGDEEDEKKLSAGSDSSKRLADFIPVVMKCASQPTMGIRQMAARALAGIINEDRAVSVLEALTNQLPKGVAPNSESVVKAGTGITTNFVHGVLMQIQQVVASALQLTGNGGSENRITNAVNVLQFLVQKFFPAKMWIWTSKSIACASIRAVYLQIVEIIAQFNAREINLVASQCASFAVDLQSLIKDIQEQCELDLQERCASNDRRFGHVPGVYVENRTLVSIYFTLQEGAPTSELPLLLQQLLRSKILEIRKKTTKLLVETIAAGVLLSTEYLKKLQRTLFDQVEVETHPQVKTRQLQLLVHCQQTLDSSAAAREAANLHFQMLLILQEASLQSKLLLILKESADANVLAPALELLALLIGANPESDVVIYRTLTNEIVAHASDKQPLILRHAAAKALRHSEVLLAKPDDARIGVDAAVDAWMTTMTLLQDDDAETRSLCRLAVEVALPKSSRSQSDTVVLPRAVEYVVNTFAATPYGSQAIATTLLGLVNGSELVQEYSYGGLKAHEWSDLTRRIFEAESSNYFAEPDLVAQLWIFHLFVADQRPSLRGLQDQVLEQLVAVLRLLDTAQPAAWLGGVTYFASVYPTLFSLLCAGLAVLKQQPVQTSELVVEIRRLAADVRERLHPVHPFVNSALKAMHGETAANDASSIQSCLYLTPYWSQLW